MHIVHTFGHLIGGTLLIAGTSIGVGMLALPIATGQSGFFPSLFVYILCWLFMLLTGLLILEACIWMPKNANLITMTQRLLGSWGRRACWVLYLFLFSCLMIAHVASGGSILAELTGLQLPHQLSMVVYVLLFSPVIYFGALWVDRLNLLMMVGVGITYILFVTTSIHYITPSFVMRSDWSLLWKGIPVIFTAFGYQSLIPTLFNYMNRDVSKVRIALILGTTIPLVIYALWQLIIVGIIPLDGSDGLIAAFNKGQNAVVPLSLYLNNNTVLNIGRGFAFFAVTTSYLGISIAFLDFLADGFKLKKSRKGRLVACLLMFLIPLIICLIDPHLFLTALNWAGGIGVALLLGLIPVLMVWAGRYYQGHSLMHQQVKGGKITLGILMLFVVLEIGVTLYG